MATHKFRAGDIVKHLPSREEWLCAGVDSSGQRLTWMGWPEGSADVADCELVQAATNKEHRACLAELIFNKDGRYRNSGIRSIFARREAALLFSPAEQGNLDRLKAEWETANQYAELMRKEWMDAERTAYERAVGLAQEKEG